MTEKQKRFCEEYLIDCNGHQSAIRAGYSRKTAYAIANKLLKKTEIKDYIEKRLDKMRSSKIADATEVMEFLTSVMRGEKSEEVPCYYQNEFKIVEKKLSGKEQVRAAELLAKRYGLTNNETQTSANIDLFKAIAEGIGKPS